MVEKYTDLYPDLNLEKYRKDYALLVNDLISSESDLTAKLYGIYIKEAEDFLKK